VKRTERIGNDIEDGPRGTSSYLVDISNGGTLIVENNTLKKVLTAATIPLPP